MQFSDVSNTLYSLSLEIQNIVISNVHQDIGLFREDQTEVQMTQSLGL